MLKKRLVGVITVKDGWAVQSFGYERYLPLGRPEVLAENLDRWGADEILLQCIDRTRLGLPPAFDVLERVARKGLSTPMIFAGGIRTAADGVRAVSAGADRVAVDAALRDAPEHVRELAAHLGAQAVVAALPMSLDDGRAAWFDYRTRTHEPLSAGLDAFVRDKVISEAMVVDWRHEGGPAPFDERLLDACPLEVPLLAFGGLGTGAQLRRVLEHPRVAAVLVGNFLNYREHAVARFKDALAGLPVRAVGGRS